MKNKRISLNEAFQLLNMLLESNEKRIVLINTDSISSFDIIKEYVNKEIKISNKPIRIRSNNNNHLESYHKLLLDCNLIYDQDGLLALDSLYDEMRLYDNNNVSIVFLVVGIHNIDGFPHDLEVFDCCNPDALTVGDFIDKLKEIDDNVAIAYCLEESVGIVGFISPSMNNCFNQYVTIQCLEQPYNVSNILQSLYAFDRQLPISFKYKKNEFAYEIDVWEKDSQDGRISYIVVKCEDPQMYIQNL